MPGDCDRLSVELSAYLDGELTGDSLRDVEAHLRTCPACQATLSELREVVSSIRGLPRHPAPAHLTAEWGRPATAEPVLNRSPARSGLRIRLWSLRALASAALLLVGVFIGWKTLPRPNVEGYAAMNRLAEPPNPQPVNQPDATQLRLAAKLPQYGVKTESMAGHLDADAPAARSGGREDDPKLARLDPHTRRALESLGYADGGKGAEKERGFLDAITQPTSTDELSALGRSAAAISRQPVVEVAVSPENAIQFNNVLNAALEAAGQPGVSQNLAVPLGQEGNYRVSETQVDVYCTAGQVLTLVNALEIQAPEKCVVTIPGSLAPRLGQTFEFDESGASNPEAAGGSAGAAAVPAPAVAESPARPSGGRGGHADFAEDRKKAGSARDKETADERESRSGDGLERAEHAGLEAAKDQTARAPEQSAAARTADGRGQFGANRRAGNRDEPVGSASQPSGEMKPTEALSKQIPQSRQNQHNANRASDQSREAGSVTLRVRISPPGTQQQAAASQPNTSQQQQQQPAPNRP